MEANGGGPVLSGVTPDVFLTLGGVVRGLRRHDSATGDELRSEWRRSGLTPRHAGALLQVAVGGPMTVSELALRLGVALPTASLVAAELSRAGWLARREDEADHRRTVLGVPEGRRPAVEDALSGVLGPLSRALAQLDGAERAGLVRGLRALARALDEPEPAEAAQPPRGHTVAAADQAGRR